jgi:GntR family transcriptional repressor for pyruvate dehydrogenase complex
MQNTRSLPSMPAVARAIAPPERLSERLAARLSDEIRVGRMAPGNRLPTEAALASAHGVSRTVVREAVTRLKSLGLVTSRQGSGVFVVKAACVPLSCDARSVQSLQAVVQMVEVRRGLEAELAALAAGRRREADLQTIRQAMQTLDDAVCASGDGAEQDVAFHRAIALAARNQFLISTLDYLRQFLRGVTRVTRANEARRQDFARQVHAEHEAIAKAIEAGDASRARRAASRHMDNALGRIQQADPAFWRQEGDRLASPLTAAVSGSCPFARPAR